VTLETGKFKLAIVENTLRGSQLFVGLPAADISEIASFVVPKHLAKGEYLFNQGDPSAGFYIVQRGAIKLHRVSAAGKEQVIHLFRPIESFAEATLATTTSYPADALATEATTVLLVPKADFIEMLRRRPDLALRMLGSMSQHLRVLVGLLDDLTLKDAETRLANWLLKQCSSSKNDRAVEINLDRTKRVLAAEMGTTSETLSRTLAKFRDHGLVRVSGKKIIVTHPAKLAELLRRHLGEL
jgi:CRP/FNR family transcriptional regulator